MGHVDFAAQASVDFLGGGGLEEQGQRFGMRAKFFTVGSMESGGTTSRRGGESGAMGTGAVHMSSLEPRTGTTMSATSPRSSRRTRALIGTGRGGSPMRARTDGAHVHPD